MSSLQALLNPMSSGPPTPTPPPTTRHFCVEIPVKRRPAPVANASGPIINTLEPVVNALEPVVSASEPAVEHVGSLVEELRVDNDDDTEEEGDIDMDRLILDAVRGTPGLMDIYGQEEQMVEEETEEEGEEKEEVEEEVDEKEAEEVVEEVVVVEEEVVVDEEVVDEEEEQEGYQSHNEPESTPLPDADSMETESDRPNGASSPPEDSEGGVFVDGDRTDEEDRATEVDTPISDREAPSLRHEHHKTPALNTPEHDIGEAMLESPYINPPAQTTIVLTPSPPLEDTITKPPPNDMLPKPKPKKKPAAPKKKGQAKPTVSKKRAPQDDGGNDMDLAIDQPSPKKKPKKASAPKPKKATSTNDLTNSIGLPKYDKDGRELYCICRKPDTGKWMIGCDGCEDWYHGECVKVKEEDGDLIDKYYCQNCYSPTQQTTWKRMCRLPNCRRPAAISDNPPSKYCSPQHGVEFMNRYAASRSTLSRGEIAALTNSVSTAAEFKHLGDRIPTPPPSSTRSYPEETKRLAEIASERAALEGRKRRIEQRGKYLAMAQRRKDRVLAELKNDPDMGKVSAICGYDERLALDDLEWDEWCTSQEGSEIFETGEIPGREAVCLKKACRGHKGWSALFTEEQVVLERLRCERLVLLRQEERKIRERQKRRAVKNERDGTVERES